MKKISSVLLTLIIFILPFVANIQTVDAKILQYGDTDETGGIGGTDKNIFNSYFAGNTVKPIQEKLMDVDNDGKITQQDVDLINGYIGATTKDSIFADKIKEDNPIKEGTYEPIYDETCKAGYGEVSKCINGYNFSSEESGLYVQKDNRDKSIDGNPTYYFRGNVNNYVSFGTYKEDVVKEVDGTQTVISKAGDPIIWRIVRINEDGSIRLITENTEVTSKWNENFLNYPEFVKDGNNSDIKNVLENWYNTTLKVDSNVDNLIQQSNFCYDISDMHQAAYQRGDKNSPIFICPEEAIINSNKVGLITLDEAIFSGMKKGSSTNTSYICNNTTFWTSVPSNTPVYEMTVANSCVIGADTKGALHGVRPVINLKADTVIMGGTGEKDSPYIVKTFKDEDRPTIMNTVNKDTENIISIDVLNKVKENNTKLIYDTYNTAKNNEDGKYLYTWKIDANNITTSKDINTVIDINKLKETDNQTYSKIKTVIKKDDADVKYLTFTEDDNIGSTATITVDVSDMGSNVSVYKWDSSTNTILVVNPNQTVEDGKVSFEVSDNTNTKNYFITKGVLSESIVGNPNTGMMMFYIIGGISVLLIAGITYLIYSKKNNKFLKA